MSRGVVLITGVNGFLGTYTALAFLDAGYTVKGTARTAAKAADWINHFPAHKAAYQSVVVADLTAPGAFEDAVKGCDIIVHVASPNPSLKAVSDNEADILAPAIRGTRSLLDSTKIEPRIRHVVFTGTLASIRERSSVVPGKVYTADDWNPLTYEEAKVSTNPRVVYGASKTLAEHAFWDYIKEEKPAWAGTTILPCGVIDPPIQPGASLPTLNNSIAFVWDLVNGKYKAGIPATQTMYVSARDLAQAHLRAAEHDVAKDKRYLLVGGSFNLAELADIIHRHFPALSDNLPAAHESTEPGLAIETSNLQTELGMEFMSFEKVLVDTITALLELQKET